LRQELVASCADSVQQAQRLAAAMQAEVLGRLQQALAEQQQALKQQRQEQAAGFGQQAEQQGAALSRAVKQLQEETDGKLSELELTLTGRVNDTSAGKAALTEAKLGELRAEWTAAVEASAAVAATQLQQLKAAAGAEAAAQAQAAHEVRGEGRVVVCGSLLCQAHTQSHTNELLRCLERLTCAGAAAAGDGERGAPGD
jgi:hypothetical protein